MQLRRLAVVFTLALLTLMGSLLVSVSPALAHCAPGVDYVTATRKNGVEVRIYASLGYDNVFNYVYHIYRTTDPVGGSTVPPSATYVGAVYGNPGPQQYLFVDEHAPLVDLYYWMKPEEISYPHPDGNPIEECGAWRANPSWYSTTPTVYTRLSRFEAKVTSTRNVNAISWTSVSERDRFGNNHVSYKLYRNTTTSFSGATLLTTINATSPGSSTGHLYAYSEMRPTTTTKYYYWVQIVLSNGTTDRYGYRLADPYGTSE
jgi:hypothetical protein